MRWDKVFQHRKPFFKVWKNWVFNNLTTFRYRFLRFCHQTTHTRQLTNLFLWTTRSRIEHHVHGIESIIIARQFFHQHIGQFRIYVRPSIDNLIITFVVGYESHIVVIQDFFHFPISFFNKFFLVFRNNHIIQIEGKSTSEGHIVTQFFDIVQKLSRTRHPTSFNNPADNVSQRFFWKQFVDITNFFGNTLIENNSSDSGLNQFFYRISIFIQIPGTNFYASMNINFMFIVSYFCFFGRIKYQSFTQSIGTWFGDIIQTKHHILRRNSNRSSISRIQNIVWSQHQQLSFQNSLIAQW